MAHQTAQDGADLQKTTTVDNNPDPYLPYRTLTNNANIAEFTEETAEGTIPKLTTTHTGGKVKYNLVTFTTNDPDNPKNWSKAYKWWCTMVIAMTCLSVALCSSVITPAIDGVVDEFGCTRTVALLSVTMFVIGFGLGPMVFAPMSEVVGRQWIYATTLLIAIVFIVPCAVAQNIETLVVCRLMGGIAMSAPMTLVGGSLADLWQAEERGVPMAVFSAAPFIGPAIGPLIGGYLQLAGWRWVYYLQLIVMGTVYIVLVGTVPETYAPVILTRRAKKMRAESGDPSFVTENEIDRLPWTATAKIVFTRPFQLLFTELIVFLISVYMSVLYGMLYMFFVAYPIVYEKDKGMTKGETGLMFIPLAVGVIGAAAFSPLVNKHYISICRKYNGTPPAEMRLIPMMWSCWLIPIGMFIFAWTSFKDLHWIGPALGGLPLGFGFIFLYNSANNYLVDTYQHQAASALAAKTFLRSIWGAVTVLFTSQMYAKMGTQWASCFLAFLGLACCAIPYVFFFYGARIRAHSKYSYKDPEAPAIMEKTDIEGR